MKIMINELNINLDELLLDLEKKNQKMDHKIMYDETGRAMIVRLYHDYTFDFDVDKITLFVNYLDDFTIRIYKPCYFSLNNMPSFFIYLYRICKGQNYEEYTLYMENEEYIWLWELLIDLILWKKLTEI